MAVFDSIGRKITQTSQDAIQKTRDLAETAKLNGLIAEEERKMQECIAQIGKMYYARYGEHPEECFRPMVLQIQNAQNNIVQYNEQIKQLKRVVVCEGCGAEMPENSIFCSSCGMKVPVTYDAGPVYSGNTCSGCGNPLKDGDMFCTGCGTRVEVQQPAEPVMSPEPEAVIRESVVVSEAERPDRAAGIPEEVPPVVEDAGADVCTQCGKELKPGMKFCTGCGSRMI